MTLNLTRLTAMARKHGLVPVFVAGEDQSVDDEIQLRTTWNDETGVAIQITEGRYFTAVEWIESELSMWFGVERSTPAAALKDALARFAGRA